LSPTQPSDGRRTLAALLALALLWGFGEASVFFVVPDVVISLIALQYGWRAGGLAILSAVFGAILGGIAVYYWGKFDISGARAFFDGLPAIAPSTIARAGHEISQADFGLLMFKGSLTGVPFKLYASEAGASGVSLFAFVILTPLVRFPRFAIAALVAGLAHHYSPRILRAHKFKLLGLFWIVFYGLFWTFAPS
jgi:membrane protein YqaA with SNARE-associated domain